MPTDNKQITKVFLTSIFTFLKLGTEVICGISENNWKCDVLKPLGIIEWIQQRWLESRQQRSEKLQVRWFTWKKDGGNDDYWVTKVHFALGGFDITGNEISWKHFKLHLLEMKQINRRCEMSQQIGQKNDFQVKIQHHTCVKHLANREITMIINEMKTKYSR